MQVVRTVFWVIILVALLVFTAFNWKPVEVKLWENMIVETKVPALVIIAFLVGLVPTWLLHRGTKWRMKRRIGQLETAARTTAASRPVPPESDPGIATADTPVPAEPVQPAAPVRPEPESPLAADEPAIEPRPVTDLDTRPPEKP